MEVEVDVVVPMEESIAALLDYFVEPYLSHEDRKTKTAMPSISQQELIAKQVHAVVLLYNYYLRKRHQSLEYLNVESFCKLAVVLKPNLMMYMKLMRQAKYSEVDSEDYLELDPEDHLSETEKSVMDACNISLALDSSKQVPNCESWPISKVAVLLTDASKEKCLLFLGNVTAGAWSVMERNVDVIDVGSNDKIGGYIVYRRKKFNKNRGKNYQNVDEVGLQKIVLSAIEETAGINQANLLILEKHKVYSLSKEKTVSCFFIVQCTQPSRGDFQISIKEVVDSLQGSLVKKKSSGWAVSSAVEYFHMLPYVGVMLDWLSRMDIDDLHISSSSAKFPDQHPDMVVLHSLEHAFQAAMVKEPDNIYSKSLIPGLEENMRDSEKQSSMGLLVPCENKELLPVGLDPKYEDLRVVLASRDEVLTQTAIRVLLHTREKLTHRLHTIEGEMASCDKAIQSILQGAKNKSGYDAHPQLPEKSNAHLV